MADDFDGFAFRREPFDLEELSTLGAYDDAPPPNPRFVRALRGELMERAEAMAQAPSRLGRRHAAGGAMRSSLAAPPVRVERRRWDRTLTFEVAAVAILLIALIGSITTRGGGNGGNEAANGVISPPVLESEHTSWMYRDNAARTNVAADTGPTGTPSVAWRTSLGDFTSLLAIADGVVITSEVNSTTLNGLSADTGNPLWSTQLGFSNPMLNAAGDGYLYLSQMSNDAEVVAIDLKTGNQVWTSTSIGNFASQPAVDDGKLYYLSTNRTLEVVDALTGKSLWSVDVTAEASKSTPNAEDDSLYYNVLNTFSVAVGEGIAVVTGGDGTATAYDLDTHEQKWSIVTDGNEVATPVIFDGSVFLPASLYHPSAESKADPNASSWLYRLDAATGEVTWKQHLGAEVRLSGMVGSSVLMLSDDRLLSITDGSIVGTVPADTDDTYYSGWTVGGDAVYALDNQGNLTSWTFDPATATFTENWHAYVASMSGNPEDGVSIVGSQLIVNGPNNSLIALAGSSSTDTAAASASPAALDFSGLTPCSPPVPVDYLDVTGEPANTITANSAVIGDDPARSGASDQAEVVSGETIGDWDLTIINDPTRQPWMDYADVPDGQPASADDVAGIMQTVSALDACNQPGSTADISGYFSDDFFRRPGVQAEVAQRADFGNPLEGLYFYVGVQFLSDYQTATVLPDGRIGILADPSGPWVDNFAMYVVFTKVGDTWVIDEAIRVGVGALMG